MSTQISTISWESTLLSWAYEALDAYEVPQPLSVTPAVLRAAYRHCDQVTKSHSRTFYMASSLLPPGKRQAVRALYAFCRVSDDLVDRAGGDPRSALAAWRTRLTSPRPPASDYVALAWADTRLRHSIPDRFEQQLLDGVARDLDAGRYATFEELATYCYGVASTVGLMTMHIAGFSGTEAIPYAVKLGVALQLTNILRDVGEDWRAGRLYLPQEELAAFGLEEADVARGQVDGRWQRFMRFQIERNRRLYTEAMPGIGMLNCDARLAIAAAADLYQAILEDIERHDMDVFNRRAHLSGWEKARRLPAVWRKIR